MEKPSAKTVYENLNDLEKVDVVTSAHYRQLAQEVLADPTVSETLRQELQNVYNRRIIWCRLEVLRNMRVIRGEF